LSAIEVLAPGLLTTVQDLGREGYGPMGVSPSGAADAIALRLGNRLVGNAEGAAGLEMTLLGGGFLFLEGGVIALTGSDFGAMLDDEALGLWTSAEVRAGQRLRLGPTKSGARCYLSVQGGVAVKPFLGSASTHLLSGLGGFEGRPLRKGDGLSIGPAERTLRKRTAAAHTLQRLSPRKVLRVTAGVQADWFSDASLQSFHNNIYRVREDSNRMGLRLEGPGLKGPPVSAQASGEMITEGISLGAVQVPESGQPIISFVEQQTTGGYPVIANVISADFSSVGQLRPRDEVRFERVGMDEARALLIEQEKMLASEDLILE
jgi:antagonist of KipI